MLKNCIFIVFILTFLTSCDKTGVGSLNNCAYAYTAYDSAGTKIVTGFLWLKIESSGSISGRWRLYKIAGAATTGPQIGTGKLRGNREGSDIWINLNPTWVDNNVTLNGKIKNGIYKGKWIYSGFPGAISWGTFIAIP